MSITYDQGKKLLELAQLANKKARVRVSSAEDKQHLGRAFLLSIVNRQSALIQPFHHRKQEIVPLDTLRFWKAGCEFDISEALDPLHKHLDIDVDNEDMLVIYSESKNAIWAGNARGWSRNIDQAQKFQQNSVNALDFASDALLISCGDAHAKLYRVPEFIEAQVENVATPIVVESCENVVSPVLNAHESSIPCDEKGKLTNMGKSSNVDTHVEKMRSFIEEIERASKDLREIESLRVEAQLRYDNAYSQLHALTSAQTEIKVNKGKNSSTVVVNRANGATHRGTQPGQLRSAILTVLAQGPSDLKTLTDKVLKMVPTTTYASACECVYSLRRKKLIQGNSRKYVLA